MSAKSDANPEIEGCAVILSSERTAPGIAPLESLGLPALLDGSQGGTGGLKRNPRLMLQTTSKRSTPGSLRALKPQHPKRLSERG